jgi:hypothetical protein
MKYILSSRQFESLGVSSYLDPIVDKVKNNLSLKSPEYILDTSIKNKKVRIKFIYNKGSEKYKGQDINSYAQLINPDPENLEFLINLGDLRDQSITHELKHVDMMVSRDLSVDFYYYLNHVGRDVMDNNENLFKDNEDYEYLNLAFYLVNPDEFEAYFNDLYKELSNEIPNETNRENKIKIIENHLNATDIYLIYKEMSKGDIFLKDFFKDRESLNYFLSLFSLKMDQFIEDDPEYDNWEIKPPVINMNYMEKYIDKLLIKQSKKGFKKFSRLYVLL